MAQTQGAAEAQPTPGYTHGHAESVLASHRRRTAADSAAHLLPLLRPGLDLLDIGSGPGSITADLATLVAPGRVVAVETSEAILDHTRAGITAAGGRDNVEYRVGDVLQLDLPDDSVDVVHAHQVLQHVSDPVTALREMVRVCRPGGVVAARDADYESFTWFPADQSLDLWLALYRRVARANGGQPDAGRRLLSWAREAGGTDVTASASTWCYADPETRAAWGLGWADRILHSEFARRAVDGGFAVADDLQRIAEAWRRWAAAEDGWFAMIHGEVLIRV